MVGRWPASKVTQIRPHVIQAKQLAKQASAYQSNAIHVGQVQKKVQCNERGSGNTLA